MRKEISPYDYKEVSYLHLVRLKHNKTLKHYNKLNLEVAKDKKSLNQQSWYLTGNKYTSKLKFTRTLVQPLSCL